MTTSVADTDQRAALGYRQVCYVPEEMSMAQGTNTRELKLLAQSATRWSELLNECQGSPSLFLYVLNRYGPAEVACHDTQSRLACFWWVIDKLRVKTEHNHRIDCLPLNVNIQQLVEDTAQLAQRQIQYSVVFNIGAQSRLVSSEMFHWPNLKWLNVGFSTTNSLALYNIVQAINAGKFAQLEALILTGANIKAETILKDLQAIKRGQLKYIETDSEVQSPMLTAVDLDVKYKIAGDGAKYCQMVSKGILSSHEGFLLDYAVVEDWSKRGQPPQITNFYGYKFSMLSPREDSRRPTTSNGVAKPRRKTSMFKKNSVGLFKKRSLV